MFLDENKKDDKITETIGAIIENSQKQTLLQFHNKTQMWTIPIGKVDPGEKVSDGLVREMREELGIEIKKSTLLLVDDDDHILVWYDQFLDKTWNFRLNLYRIDKYEGEITNMEPQKHRELKWFSKDDMMKIPEDKLTTATKTYINRKYGKVYKFDEFRLSEATEYAPEMTKDIFNHIVNRIEITYRKLCELVPFDKMRSIIDSIIKKQKTTIKLIDGDYDIEIEEHLDFSGEYAQLPKKIMVDKTIVGNRERMIMVLAHEISHHIGRNCEKLNKDEVQFLETEGYINQYLYYVSGAVSDWKMRCNLLDDPEVVDGVITKPNVEFKNEEFVKKIVDECKKFIK